MAIVVGGIAHDPDAGMIHLDDGGDALGGAEPEDGHIDRIRHGIAIERDDAERVAGQRQAANLGGAAVQHMKEDALALLHANGFSVAEHAAIDGEGVVADLVAVRHAFGERSFHRRLALIFERLHAGGRRKGVHGHVAAAAEGGLEFFQNEEDFAIVTARLVLRLDVDRSDLSAVLAGGEIGSGAIVRVIEAKARRLRHKGDATLAVRRDERRALFGGAIHIDRDELSVPVQLLGRVGVVEDVDGDGLTFFEAQQRSGELAVVSRG